MAAVQTAGWTTNVPHTPYTATAHLTLSFADGQAVDEPHPRYVVTGGTVTYDYNHSYYDCTFTAPVITFDVTVEHGGASHLTFDATGDPVAYGGVLHTRGPEFQVTSVCTTCGEPYTDTRTHRASNTWLLLDAGEYRAVSGDRTTIAGIYRVATVFSDREFFVETDYTITRTH